ncbi:sulfur carrier protein ThiS [Verrucomicrobiota bacterium]
MNITINGEQTDVADEISVSELLVAKEVKMPDTVTVELNGNILDRTKFDETVVKESDAVEFLYFMGGG